MAIHRHRTGSAVHEQVAADPSRLGISRGQEDGHRLSGLEPPR